MKTLKIFLSVGALVALLGLNVARADIKNESAEQPTFPLDTGDGSSLSPISFGTATGNEAQTTCATTPGSPSTNMLLPEPVVLPQDVESFTQYEDMSPVSSPQELKSFNPLTRQPRRWNFPPPPSNKEAPPPPEEVATPEPATMLLIGLGIGGVTMATRRQWKKAGR